MLEKIFKERIVILDGGLGTFIQKFNLTEEGFKGELFSAHPYKLKGNNDILNLTCPNVIEQIHQSFVDAGADIITTNTFNSNAISQAEYHCQDYIYKFNFEGARLARKVADKHTSKRIFVGGSIGPTSRTLSLSQNVEHPEHRSVDFDTLSEAYKLQVEALLDGGVDLLILETVFDGLNAKAAIYAIEQVQRERAIKIDLMVSVTINDKSGRTLTGQCLDALYTSISHFPIISFGLNCSFGATDLRPFMEKISQLVSCAVSIYPNAGLPNEMGEYDELPRFTAKCIQEMASDGLINIAGGCCGTTPLHIEAIAEALKYIKPREIIEKPIQLEVSGLERVVVDKQFVNFTNIGERTNVAGSRKFARLISEKKYEEASIIAKKQIEEGASIIDINMDDAMLDNKKEMETFVRIISNDPDISKAALMIDSSDWETILVGLKSAQGKCIVNSISLKEGEELFLEKAQMIKDLGAAVVIMAFDELGQADCFERKIEIAERAYKLLVERVDFKVTDIIFDVNVLSVGTGIEEHANYGLDFIKAVEWIKQNLHGAKCSGGISNLSFSFRGNNPIREAMHSVFLYHASKVGLDMGIVNPGMLQIYDDIEPELLKAVEDVVLNRTTDATEMLVAMASNISGNKEDYKQNKTQIWREAPLKQRISHALIKGISEYLEVDMKEAMLVYKTPVEIIEGPLMEGMDRVGELFGEGKMFLPQVVKSAKVMKNAVTILQPEIEKYNNSEQKQIKRNKIILATAQGDVHDIGKNILNIVLTCNNFEVIDLGVMVDNSTIIEAIKEHKADIVGLSGLITPSLAAMEQLCDMLEREKLEIPFFVGGATTSKIHTAVKLSPKYSYCVVQGGDASQSVGIIRRMIKSPVLQIETIKQQQQELREVYNNSKLELFSIEDARANAPLFQFDVKSKINTLNIEQIGFDLRQVVDYIDWTSLLHFWGFKGSLNTLLQSNSEAKRLLEDAKQELDLIINDKSFNASIIVEFFDAIKDGDDILLGNGKRLPMLRQQKDNKERCYSLVDFFSPQESHKIGLFTIAVKDILKCDGCKEYKHLLRESIAARITEATAQWMHQHVAKSENMIRPAFGYPACPDHSVKKNLFDILKVTERMDIEITEHYSINPSTAICGLLIAHPDAKYFSINKITREQLLDYAKRQNLDKDKAERLFNHLI